MREGKLTYMSAQQTTIPHSRHFQLFVDMTENDVERIPDLVQVRCGEQVIERKVFHQGVVLLYYKARRIDISDECQRKRLVLATDLCL